MMAEPRRAVAGDAGAIAALDARANPSPWSADAVRETLARAGGFVIAPPGAPLSGFVLFAQVADECEILDIAVDPAARREGLGAALLAAALAEAGTRGARRCFLEVRSSNTGAQAFYRAAGFVEDGRRKDYYRSGQGREDALLMSRELP
jgi:ribosomal-protein-alanine N-acetyltransferase